MSSLQLTLVARHLTGSQETADLCTPHQTHLEACMTFECKMQPLIMVVFMQITIIAITIQSNNTGAHEWKECPTPNTADRTEFCTYQVAGSSGFTLWKVL